MNPDDIDSQEDLVVDSLGTGIVKDYDRLISEFGIEPLSNVIDKIPLDKQHHFMKRGIMFGHTALNPVIDAINKKKRFSVMTGIKPSGKYHVGSISTAMEVIYFQQLGGKVSFAINKKTVAIFDQDNVPSELLDLINRETIAPIS